ncbi:solute carrier family 22 member 4-like [Megalops cyprinoides]|uniref:solute carrier family 22 member 4-like n=1 Tax=Megalops cyprinoides TaxID=118141 RepID=UPI001864CE5C|nr:solute carrier family 22 member 4-like [Megalops cyprinoides]
MRDYEEIVSFLGEWGPFQKTIFFLLSASSIPNGYVGMAVVFIADVPSHHCRLPLNLSSAVFELNQSIPTEEVKGEIILSRCTRYKNLDGLVPGFGNETEACLDGWEFSTERYTSTIVSEWNLVCEDAWKAPFSVTVFFFGVLIGSFLSGQISDRYGRKLIFFATLALQTIASLLQAASNSWELFCVFYFIVGMGQIANYCVAFILGSELLSKSVRIPFSTLGISMCYAVGYACLPFFAYFIRGWRMLLLALSIPGFLYIPLWWYIPESPRWLLSQGRLEEAEAIIRAAACKNRVTAPDVIFRQDDCTKLMETNDSKKSEHLYTWLDLFKTTNIRNITIIQIIVWVVISMTYYGLSLNTPNMNGDPYLNCFISAATEFVGYGATWLFLCYMSRRFSLTFMLLLCGVTLLLLKFIPDELNILVLTLVMTGKTGITAAFCFVYMYGTELFPTVVRNMGLGATSMASRIGSGTSPYIAHIGKYNKIIPYILMGSITIVTGILSLLLPETKDEELPEHISQVKPLRCTNYLVFLNHSKSMVMRDYDEITSFLGEWGPFQQSIFILLSLSTVPNGYAGMSMVFLAGTPHQHCSLPYLNGSMTNLSEALSMEEVKGHLDQSRCTRYKWLNSTGKPFGNETESCMDGWDYSTEQYVSTIVTEVRMLLLSWINWMLSAA